MKKQCLLLKIIRTHPYMSTFIIVLVIAYAIILGFYCFFELSFENKILDFCLCIIGSLLTICSFAFIYLNITENDMEISQSIKLASKKVIKDLKDSFEFGDKDVIVCFGGNAQNLIEKYLFKKNKNVKNIVVLEKVNLNKTVSTSVCTIKGKTQFAIVVINSGTYMLDTDGISRINKSKNVIIFEDLIKSGNSINTLKNVIKSISKKKQRKIYTYSYIADYVYKPMQKIDKVYKYKTIKSDFNFPWRNTK